MAVEILVPIAFFAAIVWIVKIISDNRIRRKVLDQRVSDELADAILNKNVAAPSALSALKWGLVVVAIGGALVLVQLLSIDADEPLTFGLLFLAAGAGLVAYYMIASEDESAPTERSGEYMPDFSSSEEL
jgi:hypothetical protein